jgi:hypothetical protein
MSWCCNKGIPIFGNWTECCMCGDYHPMNKQTCLNKYAILLLKEIFDTLG